MTVTGVWVRGSQKAGGEEQRDSFRLSMRKKEKTEFAREISCLSGFSSGKTMLILPHGLFQARVA